jgi:hypothetical protein
LLRFFAFSKKIAKKYKKKCNTDGFGWTLTADGGFSLDFDAKKLFSRAIFFKKTDDKPGNLI